MVVSLWLTLFAAAASAAMPNNHVWGCLKGNVSAALAFCDHTRPVDGG